MATLRFQVQSIMQAGTYQTPGTPESEARFTVQLTQLVDGPTPAASLSFNLNKAEAEEYFPGDIFAVTLTHEGSATPSPGEV